jgi:predicted RNA binding protein YcfA (HicA-like mRNA interferase family)
MDLLLKRLGFVILRQKGSHVFYKHEDGRTTTVPLHKGKDLPRPLIRKILRDIDLSTDDYESELQDL